MPKNDPITVELHIRPDLLVERGDDTPEALVRRQDALVTMLGRLALEGARHKFREREAERLKPKES